MNSITVMGDALVQIKCKGACYSPVFRAEGAQKFILQAAEPLLQITSLYHMGFPFILQIT